MAFKPIWRPIELSVAGEFAVNATNMQIMDRTRAWLSVIDLPFLKNVRNEARLRERTKALDLHYLAHRLARCAVAFCTAGMAARRAR